MTHNLSTIAKRKAIAKKISKIATDVVNLPINLTAHEMLDHTLSCRVEDFETERGKVNHLSIEVNKRCIAVHIKFACADLAPMHANPYSGKWNHYFGADVTATDLEFSLAVILEQVRCNGLTRQDRPSMADWYGAQLLDWAEARA